VLNYDTSSHKRGKFVQAPRNLNLVYTPTTCIETIEQNQLWNDFEQFYALIISSQELQAYAFHTYLDLAFFWKLGQTQKNQICTSCTTKMHTPNLLEVGAKVI